MNSNYNYNNNYMPEFNDFENGIKILNAKFPAVSMPPSPLKSRAKNVFFYKSASFQTATNIAASERYCADFIFEPRFDIDARHDHVQPQFQYHSRSNYQEKTSDRRHISPPPLVHHAAHRGANNNDGKHGPHHRRPTQAASMSEQARSQLINFTSKQLSTDQHYQHYYSYYYNRQVEPQRKIKMSRASLLNSLKKDSHTGGETKMQNYREIVNPLYETQRYGNSVDDNRTVHQVLKEKSSNNNILGYDNNEWLTQMNESDILNATKDFDVKDVDDYAKKLTFTNGIDTKMRETEKLKGKSRTNSGSNELHSPSNKSWKDTGITNNNYDYEQLTQWEVSPKPRRSVKLPITPFNVKGIMENKRSPPRVLIYNNQSPRLSRISRPIQRGQEHTKNRSSSSSVSESVVLEKKKNENEKASQLKTFEIVGGYVSPQPGLKIALNDAKNKGNDNDNDASSNDDYDDDLDNVSDFGEGSASNESSDSEDGYRTYAYKLTHSSDRHLINTPLSSDASEEDLINPQSLLVPSLFPNVPPYISFSTHINKGPNVPPELQRLMKWRVSNVMPKVVRSVLANSGMRLVKKTNDWMGVWGKHMKSPCFKTIRPYQKINHLPGSFKIGRKDSCWRNLQKQMNRHGKKEFGFMPKTYIIPYDLNLLRKNWPKYSQSNVKWIIKPPASARGTGIRVVNRWAQIPKRRPLIVQKYIERPLLINGSKFDLRLYVLVTSMNPLRVFMYHNGLARFASVKYSDKTETLNDRCMHLTNYSINKLSSNYSKNEDVNACHGHKWTLKSLWSYLGNRGVRTDGLWEALRNLVLRTIMAGENSINNMIRLNVGSKYSCYELFGFDVLLDSDLIPWLLEVNISPSLHSELPLDAHVKAPLVQGVLNTALYNIPPKLSMERQRELAIEMSLPAGPICYDKRMYINYLSRIEKIKHNTFTRKAMEDRDEYINSILDNLTPDDVRCLVIAEDELARCAPLERIFPTSHTYKYLKYTDTPRYYNRLLDAWETRYGNNRAEGIALLRSFCERKHHLDVPPPPAKKPLKYRTRTLMRKTRIMKLMRSNFYAMCLERKNAYKTLIRPKPDIQHNVYNEIDSATITKDE